MTEPLEPVGDGAGNGRDPRTGRFGTGNRFSRGNPNARRVARLRAALLRAIDPDDVAAVVRSLRLKALSGDVLACKVLLDRALGPPEAIDLREERIIPEGAAREMVEAVMDALIARVGGDTARTVWEDMLRAEGVALDSARPAGKR